MYHGDPSHGGVSSSMPKVTGPLKVIASVKLDGAVYASPIVVGGIVVVATENDSVYAFSTKGKRLWHVKVASPSPAYQRDCGNIDPLGITGTPIYSAKTGDVYLVAEHDGKVVGHDLIALALRTGKIRWRKNIDLPGPAPAAMQQRGALAITGGRVWVSFGAQYGDCSNYKGRVVGVKLDGTGKPVAYDPSPHRQGGIWNPAGPTLDHAGHMYVVSANGSTFPGAAYDHTNSVLELSPSGKLLSSFAPADWAQNNAATSASARRAWPSSARSGRCSAASRAPYTCCGRESSAASAARYPHADICLPYGGSAVSGSVVYLPCADGVAAVRVDSAGRLHELWQADGSIAGSPVIGGGRVWALDQYSGVLHALSPANGRSPRAGFRRRDQPVRHPGALRQPGARAHHDRRDLRQVLAAGVSPPPAPGRRLTVATRPSVRRA